MSNFFNSPPGCSFRNNSSIKPIPSSGKSIWIDSKYFSFFVQVLLAPGKNGCFTEECVHPQTLIASLAEKQGFHLWLKEAIIVQTWCNCTIRSRESYGWDDNLSNCLAKSIRIGFTNKIWITIGVGAKQLYYCSLPEWRGCLSNIHSFQPGH